MICQNCSRTIPEASVFCPHCGAKVCAPAAETDTAPYTPPAPVQTSMPVPPPVITQALNSSPAPTLTPEPAPVDLPAQIIEAPEQPAPEKARRKKSSAGKIVAVVLLCLLCAASMGLNVYQYIRNTDSEKKLTSQLKAATQDAEDLQEDVEDLQAKVDQHSKTIKELNESLREKDSTIRTQEESIAALSSELAEVQDRAEAFDLICDELRYQNVGYAASNYYASTGVVIMDRWYSEQFTVKANWSSAFTVTLSETTSIVDANWGEDWYSDGETIDVILTPTGVTGVDIITFTNNIDSKTFKVLVIVTD